MRTGPACGRPIGRSLRAVASPSRQARTIQDEIAEAHACLKRVFPDIERVAAAVYDPKTDLLKTFAHSTDGGNPLEFYEASLGDIPSLGRLAESGDHRVVDDLSHLAESPHAHTRRLIERGFRSSYTMPLFEGGRLFGFLFFDSILLKAGPLTPAEFEVMQSHVLKGVEIVDGILAELDLHAVGHLEMLRNVVHFHHESVDGCGYPQGRRGAEIPIEARIVKVADVFDALTSRRPYKRAWPVDDALRFLSDGAGGACRGGHLVARALRRSGRRRAVSRGLFAGSLTGGSPAV
jgi:HD domain